MCVNSSERVQPSAPPHSPPSSSLVACSPGGSLSSHAACFWVSLTFGGASKDYLSRWVERRDFESWTLFRMEREERLWGPGRLQAPVWGWHCLLIPFVLTPGRSQCPFSAETTDSVPADGLMEPEWLSRDAPAPLLRGNLRLALAPLISPATNALPPSLLLAVTFPGSLLVPSLSCLRCPPCPRCGQREQHGQEGAGV